MKRLYLIPLALLLVGLTTAVFAAPPDSAQSGQQGFHKHFGFILNLTDEQKGKMKETRDRFQADVHDLKYDIRIKKMRRRSSSPILQQTTRPFCKGERIERPQA